MELTSILIITGVVATFLVGYVIGSVVRVATNMSFYKRGVADALQQQQPMSPANINSQPAGGDDTPESKMTYGFDLTKCN